MLLWTKNLSLYRWNHMLLWTKHLHHFTNGIQLLSMFVSENHSSHSEENKFHAHKKSETVKQWNTLKPLSLSLYCEEVIHTNKMTSLFSVHRMTRHLCTWLPVKVTSRLLMFFCWLPAILINKPRYKQTQPSWSPHITLKKSI